MKWLLDQSLKRILAVMYVSQITGTSSEAEIRKNSMLSVQEISDRIDELARNQLVDADRKTLTDLGRDSLRVVLAGGVFDIIHPGHIHTLNAARALGDVLVVVVATDNTTAKMKKKMPLHSQEQRQEMVTPLSMVDLCLIGQEDDIFKTVDNVRPEIIALGYDQIHQEGFITKGCKRINLNAKVVRLQSPVPEISSSKIQKEYGESIHGI